MGFKRIVLFLLVGLCVGCMTPNKRAQLDYKEDYRDAVKHEIKQIMGEFQGGKFPYYHWSAPIVQEVSVPAHIKNGVFIPEHVQLVLIKPGEWAKDQSYPISTKKEQHEKQYHTTNPNTVSDITSTP